MNTKVYEFLAQQHLLSLATIDETGAPYCTSCFYVFDEKNHSFIFASSEDTNHIEHIQANPKVAGTVALQTKQIGKIQGIQLTGMVHRAKKEDSKRYLKAFPYALAMNPKLWCLHVAYIKYTDNRFGFGKKEEYFF